MKRRIQIEVEDQGLEQIRRMQAEGILTVSQTSSSEEEKPVSIQPFKWDVERDSAFNGVNRWLDNERGRDYMSGAIVEPVGSLVGKVSSETAHKWIAQISKMWHEA